MFGNIIDAEEVCEAACGTWELHKGGGDGDSDSDVNSNNKCWEQVIMYCLAGRYNFPRPLHTVQNISSSYHHEQATADEVHGRQGPAGTGRPERPVGVYGLCECCIAGGWNGAVCL